MRSGYFVKDSRKSRQPGNGTKQQNRESSGGHRSPCEDILIQRPVNFPEVAVVFPAPYRTGASSLGFSMLYEAFSKVSRPRRYFLENGVFVSPDTFDPLGRNRIIAFSIAFEPDIISVFEALTAAGIPGLTKRRGRFDPYIIAGGVGITLAPRIASAVFDAVFLGEGDFRGVSQSQRVVEVVAQALANAVVSGAASCREEIPNVLRISLDAIFKPSAGDDGVSAPDCQTPPPHRPSSAMTETETEFGGFSFRFPAGALKVPVASSFVSPEAEFSSAGLIEVARGCPAGCRFCFACHGFKPFRPVPADLICEVIGERFYANGVNSVGLVGAAASRHPEISRIVDFVKSKGMRPTLSSVPVELMETLSQTALLGQKSVAVALESASAELQERINKPWELSCALRGAACLGSCGVKELKLYVMVGIPTGEKTSSAKSAKDSAHLTETIQSCLEISGAFRKAGGARVRISVNPFVPKPGTPMEYEPMMGRKEYKAAGTVFREKLRSQGCDVIFENIDTSYLQLCATICPDPEAFLTNPPGKRDLEEMSVSRNFTI